MVVAVVVVVVVGVDVVAWTLGRGRYDAHTPIHTHPLIMLNTTAVAVCCCTQRVRAAACE